MSEPLKPCPFCGSAEIEVERPGTNRQSCIVACGYCGCRLESNEIGSGADWNRRVVADRVAKKVRELERPPQPRRIPAGTYRPYGGASADLVIIDDPIIRPGDMWSADPSTATPLADMRAVQERMRQYSAGGAEDSMLGRADEAMLAWKRSQDPDLKLEGRIIPESMFPSVEVRMSRDRYYVKRRLSESEILGADFPEALPGILRGMLGNLEAIEAGQNPATVL